MPTKKLPTKKMKYATVDQVMDSELLTILVIGCDKLFVTSKNGLRNISLVAPTKKLSPIDDKDL